MMLDSRGGLALLVLSMMTTVAQSAHAQTPPALRSTAGLESSATESSRSDSGATPRPPPEAGASDSRSSLEVGVGTLVKTSQVPDGGRGREFKTGTAPALGGHFRFQTEQRLILGFEGHYITTVGRSTRPSRQFEGEVPIRAQDGSLFFQMGQRLRRRDIVLLVGLGYGIDALTFENSESLPEVWSAGPIVQPSAWWKVADEFQIALSVHAQIAPHLSDDLEQFVDSPIYGFGGSAEARWNFTRRWIVGVRYQPSFRRGKASATAVDYDDVTHSALATLGLALSDERR